MKKKLRRKLRLILSSNDHDYIARECARIGVSYTKAMEFYRQDIKTQVRYILNES